MPKPKTVKVVCARDGVHVHFPAGAAGRRLTEDPACPGGLRDSCVLYAHDEPREVELTRYVRVRVKVGDLRIVQDAPGAAPDLQANSRDDE